MLVSDDGYVETPDDDGNFCDIDDLAVWTVAGDSTKPRPSQADSHSLTPYAYQPPPGGKRGRGRKWTPAFNTALFQRQKPPGVRAQESDRAGPSSADPLQLEWRKNIEVCKWSERERQWKKVSNLPLLLTEVTANLQRVSQMVATDAFCGESTLLLDVDYLKIPDIASTRGKQFRALHVITRSLGWA